MTKKLIFNPENPKGILVDLTEAELSQKVIDDEKSVIRKTERDAEQAATQVRLDSVKEKLEGLGLTTEEVKTAFGI